MLEVGANIKGYRIERLLGRGGMAEVYEATQLGLGRRVAFKVLHMRLGEDAAFRERFRREGQLQATLEHPHVVTVYEAGELDDGLFLAMRLVEGPTLKQLIVAGELDAERTLRILGPIAEALDAAHGAGLVHRDVKPQNILVGEGDHAFLADFGLTQGRDQSGFTRSGQFVGTIDYISPEQVRGEPAGPASDVYAFAGVLYECLTGTVPFPKPSDAAVLYSHVNDPPPRVSDARTELPRELDSALAAGMAKEPDERPASAFELVALTEAALGGDPDLARSRPPRTGSLAHGVRGVAGETVAGETPATVPIGDRGPLAAAGGGGRTNRASSGPGRWRFALLASAGVALFAALAFFGGRALGGEEPAELTASVAGEAVALKAPGGWTATSPGERPAVPGLDLRDQVGVAPAERDGSGAMAGMTAAAGPSLLPAELRRRVRGPLPEPAAVRLGELEALRYRDLRVRGFDRELTLYASPSTAGVATVACYTPSPQAAMTTPLCESVAQTLELLRGRPYPLAIESASEHQLSRIVRRLDRDRAAARRRLADADTAEAQAAAARALRQVYLEAAGQLSKLDVSPLLAGAVDEAADAMDTAAATYGLAAFAAADGDGAGYEAALDEVRFAERRAARSLAAIDRAAEQAGDRS